MKIRKDIVIRKIGDKSYIIPYGEQKKAFHGIVELNTTASFIWNCISNGKNEDEIADTLVEKYKIEKDKAYIDILNVVKQLKDAGIIEDSDDK